MSQHKLLVVSKFSDNHCPHIKQSLDDDFTVECFASCQLIPLEKNSRPLLQRARVILFFMEGWSIAEVKRETALLCPSDEGHKLYAILYITDANRLDEVTTLLTEDDDVILDSYNPVILGPKIRQLVRRSNLLKKLHRDLNEASEIALLSMANSSELGEISRFILSSYGCSSYEELLEALFQTVTIFGVSVTALIVVDDGVITRLGDKAQAGTRATLLRHHNQGRIHHYGQETIITFSHASMMIHDMPLGNDSQYGRLLDNLTVLGNCFEARVKGIYAEQKADSASQAKTMFLATMSHELRTPMNSVIGFTERLIEKLDGRLSEREERQLFAIKRNGDHLLSLINDILDMSKIEVGKMEIHPEKLEAIEAINNIYLQLQPIANNSHIEFQFVTPLHECIINADRTRFTQMVMNLTSNAIKYTENGFVHISATEINDPELGESLCIAIEDSGIGISEEDQKKLFANFVQIDSELCRKVQGTGLGLAITMIFADMHHGRIDVKSELNVGSCFSLILPLSTNPNATEIVDVSAMVPPPHYHDRDGPNVQLF